MSPEIVPVTEGWDACTGIPFPKETTGISCAVTARSGLTCQLFLTHLPSPLPGITLAAGPALHLGYGSRGKVASF